MSTDTSTCNTCEKEFEKTKDNFYTSKGKLKTTICKGCKKQKNDKYRDRVDQKKEYQKRKEKMKEYQQKRLKEKVECYCGLTISMLYLTKHKKTIKHHIRLEKVLQA